MLNEDQYWILRYFPLMRLPLSYFGWLARPSTSMAAKDIVIMADNISKAEMQTILQQTLDERGIMAKRTKLGQNIVCRVGSPYNVNDLLRVGAHRASAILIQVNNN